MDNEDNIRALLGEMKRAPRAKGPNMCVKTPEGMRAEEELRRWQAEQAYMGGGRSDLMYRTPPKRMTTPSRAPSPSNYMTDPIRR